MSNSDSQTPNSGSGPSDIRPISIVEEMKRSYLDYAMSVIVARALPDARDGLKPVHRRILYSMHENGYEWNKPYRKSARVVGDVIGKYHPHGDQAVYDALVRMAQDFLHAPAADRRAGQFRLGRRRSAGGDALHRGAAAKVANALLEDIDKDTVDFLANYDNSEREPVVLPARFPNLLVNGAGGIAVGMATNIPPHNLGEVIDGAIALIDDPALGIDDLIKLVPGPGFPDRRHHPRPRRHPCRLSSRPRLDRHARQAYDRDAAPRARSHHHHRNPLPGEQGQHGGADRRTREARRRSTASPTCATSPTATATAS